MPCEEYLLSKFLTHLTYCILISFKLGWPLKFSIVQGDATVLNSEGYRYGGLWPRKF